MAGITSAQSPVVKSGRRYFKPVRRRVQANEGTLVCVARPRSPRPTDGELVILQVLWRQQNATVRQVHDEMKKTRSSGYNSVLKLMQIMTGKGYVRRREPAERPHVYHASLSEQEARRTMLKDLMDRVFGGSSRQLILQALAIKKPTLLELVQLRDHIEKLVKGALPPPPPA
ncbi:MAG: BlaI/MecI/CopY family transcriptional regulator [Tepidisphaeraceae bacterium]